MHFVHFCRYLNKSASASSIMKRSAENNARSSKQKNKNTKSSEESSETTEVPSSSSSTSINGSSSKQFQIVLQQNRLSASASVKDFRFLKTRVRVLSKASEIREQCTGGVLYWMSRDARVQDNWAFLFAQKLALKFEVPLFVAYCLVPKFLNATLRHYKFMLDGLKEVEADCRPLDIPFRLLLGPAAQRIPEFVRDYNIGAVVCDFAPLRVPLQWLEDVKNALPEDVPLSQVDAHNVIPIWVTSEKQEYSARTIRGKINGKLQEYLTEFPPLIKHPHKCSKKLEEVDWKSAYASLECDMTIDEVDWAKPGYTAACAQLDDFSKKRLRFFYDKRNDPTVDAVSGLSPWFHFGQISVQRCILEVNKYKSKFKASVEAFCEEAIVRRELADNFCYYNENYDNLKGLHAWAYKTLDDHRKDKRSPCYSLSEFEAAKTHDDLWNSAQLQLVREGKIHGFLRMYWAKKILEWSTTPEQALEIAIFLNDKYSLDGRDANGYVGCMWSIGGVHDQGWLERPIFGKIRFMNYKGCKRKFDVDAFVTRYGGKVYTK